jgi:hypothetical protein
MCCAPFDDAYPGYGGKWQRTDRFHGRVGSSFDPAGPAPAEISLESVEGKLEPTPALPMDDMPMEDMPPPSAPEDGETQEPVADPLLDTPFPVNDA